VTANPWTATDTGFDREFDEFHAVGEDSRMVRNGPVANLANRISDSDIEEWLLRWTDFYEILEKLQTVVSEPYFLWVFLLDPHQPYLAPRKYRRENTGVGMYYANIRYNKFQAYTDDLPNHLDDRLKRAYNDTVRSIDSFVERLSETIGQDFVTVLHADHGEAFGEHGFYGHRPQLYEEVVRVPLVVHGIKKSARISEVLPLRHLPLILEKIGGASSGTAGRDLGSNEPILNDPHRYVAPHAVIKTEEEEQVAIRSRDWKYINRDDSWDYINGSETEELYHLQNDPGEEQNLIDERPRVAATHRELLRRHTHSEEERDSITSAVRKLDNLIISERNISR